MNDRELMQQAQPVQTMSHGGRPMTMREIMEAEEPAQPEHEPVDSAEKAGAYMNERLWEFIDMAAAWPKAKPDPRTWDHVMAYAPKQPQMQPCAGRNCGSTNPNLHSAECFEDYEKSTGMEQPAQQEPISLLRYEPEIFREDRIRMELDSTGDWVKYEDVVALIAQSPQPAQRKPMDAGEVSRLWRQHTNEDGPHHNPYDDDGLAFARAIEAAHNIKEHT